MTAKSPAQFRAQHKRSGPPSGRVEFRSDENMVFTVPVNDQTQSPVPTLSSCSGRSMFLDEIALLKRGKITRDTPKNTYKRGLSAEDGAAVITNEKPITIAELNSRGLKVDSNHIIYSIPNDPSIFCESSTMRNSIGSSSGGTPHSFVSTPRNVKEFNVGYPDEHAKLRVSSTSHDGRSYELNTDSDTCFLQQTSKNVVLITWKN